MILNKDLYETFDYWFSSSLHYKRIVARAYNIILTIDKHKAKHCGSYYYYYYLYDIYFIRQVHFL